jgi:hypothetical protein
LASQNLELLLDLLEPRSHALLIEVPEIAAQHIVGLPQLIEVLGKGAGAIPHIPIHLGDAFDALDQAIDALILSSSQIRDMSVDFLSQVFVPFKDGLMPLDRLGLESSQILAERSVVCPQFFKRWIDVTDRRAGLFDQIERVRDVGSHLVDAGSCCVRGVNNLLRAAPGFLVDDPDSVFVAQHIAPDLIDLAFDQIERVSKLVGNDRVAVADS